MFFKIVGTNSHKYSEISENFGSESPLIETFRNGLGTCKMMMFTIRSPAFSEFLRYF